MNSKQPFLAIIFFNKPDFLGGTKIYCKKTDNGFQLPLVEVQEEKKVSSALSGIISKNISLGIIVPHESIKLNPKERFNGYTAISIVSCEIAETTMPSMGDEFMSISDILNNRLMPNYMLEAIMHFDCKKAA